MLPAFNASLFMRLLGPVKIITFSDRSATTHPWGRCMKFDANET